MAAKKKTGTIGSGTSGSSSNKNKNVGRTPGSPPPTPAAAARRDFLTGGTGQGSGRAAVNKSSTWQSQYNLEMSRLKRNSMTTSGQGSGRPKNPGSEGPKTRKPRIPKTK